MKSIRIRQHQAEVVRRTPTGAKRKADTEKERKEKRNKKEEIIDGLWLEAQLAVCGHLESFTGLVCVSRSPRRGSRLRLMASWVNQFNTTEPFCRTIMNISRNEYSVTHFFFS